MSLVVKDLSCVYAQGTPFEVQALKNINLTVNDGELVGIVGHTGSGKSTLIQHFNGLMVPHSGCVLVDGEDINKAENKRKYRLKVGLVFQYPEYQLFEETVLKDVEFGPKNQGKTGDEAREAAVSALKTVGLEQDKWDKSPFELSGGQKRRAAIAGVLAMRPEILVLDEPAAGLDPVGRKEMLSLIKTINAGGTTVIMVSHSMDDVAETCRRVIAIKGGCLCYDGSPAGLFCNEELINDLRLDFPEAAKLRNMLKAKGFAIDDDIYTAEALAGAVIKLFKDKLFKDKQNKDK